MASPPLPLADVRDPTELKELQGKMVELNHLLESTPNFKPNFYRYLTNDAGRLRHNIIEPQPLQRFCPLDNGRLGTGEKEEDDVASRGLFARLSLELIITIFIDELDLATLTRLRSVSRGIRAMISSLPQYDAIVTNAPASLRASLSLQTAAWTSCRDLYEQLCVPDCAGNCGNFAPFLHLPTCQRVCYQCFTNEEKCPPVSAAWMRYTIGAKSKRLEDAQTAPTLPGNYTERRSKDDSNIFAYINAGISAGFGVGKYIAWDAMQRRATQDILGAKHRAWSDTASRAGRPTRPTHLNGFAWMQHSFERYHCVVGFPWLDRSTGALDWGVACNGCKARPNWNCSDPNIRLIEEEHKKKQNILYTKDGFLWHLLLCEPGKKLMGRKMDANLGARKRGGKKERITGPLFGMGGAAGQRGFD